MLLFGSVSEGENLLVTYCHAAYEGTWFRMPGEGKKPDWVFSPNAIAEPRPHINLLFATPPKDGDAICLEERAGYAEWPAQNSRQT
jgi:hypothetical protein